MEKDVFVQVPQRLLSLCSLQLFEKDRANTASSPNTKHPPTSRQAAAAQRGCRAGLCLPPPPPAGSCCQTSARMRKQACHRRSCPPASMARHFWGASIRIYPSRTASNRTRRQNRPSARSALSKGRFLMGLSRTNRDSDLLFYGDSPCSLTPITGS